MSADMSPYCSGHDEWQIMKLSRILPGGDIFSLDLKIYLYQNISTNSVTESKTHHLVIGFILLQRHSVT